MKLENKQIILNASIETVSDLFKLLAKTGKELGVVDVEKDLEKGFWDREKDGSTGMEYGFSIPHAKTNKIKEPTVIVVKMKNHIKNYETLDNSKVNVAIALLIPEKDLETKQMKLLSAVALKLNDEKFRDNILRSKSKKQIIDLFKDVSFKNIDISKTNKNASLRVVGITSCAAGIAHTYIARDNLIEEGNKKNYHIRIETQGASGPEDALTKKEIQEADLVIIASDIKVDLSRFIGKKIYMNSIHPAVKDATKFLETSVKESKIYKKSNEENNSETMIGENRKFISHIMNGISWMIPLLVAAAILIAIPSISGAFVGKTDIVTSGDWKKMVANGLDGAYWKFMFLMIKIGWTSISLMFPIFAAFTAYSIGNKPAFIPALIGGFLAKPGMLFKSSFSDWFSGGYPFLDKTSGFWGALIIGIAIGFIIKYSNNYIKLPNKIRSIKPMLLLPMIGILSSVILMVLVINPTFGLLNEQLIKLGENAGKSGKYVLALIIAPMTASDLGLPINKAAVTTMYQFYEAKTFSLTMRVIPTITPSIGLGVAAMLDKFIVRRRVFDDDVRKAAPNAIILAMLGISEGGLPFIFKRPLLTIPINMLGGFIGATIGILTNTEQWFPDSAIWAWPFAKPIWGLLLGITVGFVSTALMHIYFRYLLEKLGKIKIDAKYNREKLANGKS